MQSDPIALVGGINLFWYADDNPIRLADPFGLFTYNAGPPQTEPLPPATEHKVVCIEKCMAIQLVVTGGAEEFCIPSRPTFRCHGETSKHYTGHAADFGFASNPGLQTQAALFYCCAGGRR